MPIETEKVISFITASPILPIIFAAVIVAYVVMSSIYMYHWKKYGIEPKVIRVVQITYFVVSIFFIGGALVALLTV